MAFKRVVTVKDLRSPPKKRRERHSPPKISEQYSFITPHDSNGNYFAVPSISDGRLRAGRTAVDTITYRLRQRTGKDAQRQTMTEATQAAMRDAPRNSGGISQ